ncbi:MAG: glycosyltransferase [Planctomycetaceae bacterium]|nr:glycosyltransferase [Planctomycetaceae bacterium]
MNQQLLVSVIIPLLDDRGQAKACLESFLQQTLPQSAVELILPSNHVAPELENEVRRSFPDVRITSHPGATLPALYNAGVSAACGQYVFITEMHVVAQPDCLEEAIRYVESRSDSAACCESLGINLSRIAAAEQCVFEEDIKQWKTSGRGKVTVRGFLIERETWNRAGGLPEEFGHFSELLMGQTLLESGTQIGYADRSIIGHGNQNSFSELFAELFEYGQDEIRCHRLKPEMLSHSPCHDWLLFSNGHWSRMALRRKAATNAIRLKVLKLAMTYLPLPSSEWQKLFVNFWQTSIRAGRLDELLSYDRSSQSFEKQSSQRSMTRQKAA